MKIYPPFPTCREATPTRRAEKLIYEALEASDLDGLALFEVKPLSSAPQLDFAVWLLDVGTFGIQTKGGRYIIIDGETLTTGGFSKSLYALRFGDHLWELIASNSTLRYSTLSVDNGSRLKP